VIALRSTPPWTSIGAVSNDRRGKAIQQEVGVIVSMVVAFSVTAVILLVLAGYALHAYVGESTVRKQLALFPECNPHPILTVSTNGEPVYANRGALKMLVDCGLQPRDLPRLCRDLACCPLCGARVCLRIASNIIRVGAICLVRSIRCPMTTCSTCTSRISPSTNEPKRGSFSRPIMTR
jgi:hypothetical protein